MAGAWSCIHGFNRQSLTDALHERSVVQATLMRGTIHLVSARDFWLFAAAIRGARHAWWLRAHRPHSERVDMDAADAALHEFLSGTTRRRDELVTLLRRFDPPGAPHGLAWSGIGVELVRVPPSGTWERRRAHTFALAEDWLGPATVSEEDGLEHLARLYLSAFGPATRDDLSSWAGVSTAAFAPVLARLRLRRFRGEDDRELLDVARAPLPDAETPAPVRFLPTFDAALLAHARRTQILPERHRPRVFHTKAPQSFHTFLVDGRVAGTWKVDSGRVVVAPFEPIARAARREVDAEAKRLADWLAAASVSSRS